MDQEPDLTSKTPGEIRQQIDQTRSALTNKLETLECEVRQTVRQATDAVVGTVDSVRHTVEDTVETVKGGVEGAVGSVKHAFDIRGQAVDHPWIAIGCAAAAGFVAGCVVGPHPIAALAHTTERLNSEGRASTPASTSYQADGFERSAPKTRAGWLSELAHQFAPEIDKLKGLAIGTALGILRDNVKEAAPPNLASQLVTVIDRVTEKLGGQSIRGPVLVPRASHVDTAG